MNDKMLNIFFFLFFIMIGINGFLAYTLQLQDASGNDFAEFYGLTSDGFSKSGLEAKTNDATFASTAIEGASSESPSTEEGLATPVHSTTNQPATLDIFSYGTILIGGVELVMLKFSAMFPFLQPLTYSIIAFALFLKGLMLMYIGNNILQMPGRRT